MVSVLRGRQHTGNDERSPWNSGGGKGFPMSVARRSGLDLLEESVDLLRRAPASAWVWYLAGAVSFFGATLIFCSRMTGVTAVPDPAMWALVIAVLFGWRQYSRAWFAGELYRMLASEQKARHSAGAFALAWFAGIARLPLLVIPFPALIALFRNVSVMAVRAEDPVAAFRRAGALAARGSDQLVPLLTIAGATVILWVNVFTGMLALPTMVQIFTGQDVVFLRNSEALLNSTVLIASLMVTWCIVDSLLSAFYALRVFYGESEETGADLLGSWRQAIARVAVAISLLICVVGIARAAESPPSDLRQSIDQVLKEQPYQWREPLAPAKEQNAFVRWTDNLMARFRRSMQVVRRELARFIDWLRDLLGSRPEPKSNAAPPVLGLSVFAWLVILFLAGALVALLMHSKIFQGHRGKAEALPSGPPAIDLEDPALLANQLPEDEWIAMAQDFMSRGEFRMALRAWFLASLAFLASREMLVIAKAKTNKDYQREVRLRARTAAGVDSLFASGVLSFESAWYGLRTVSDSEVQGFAATFHNMRKLAGGS
jgi:hypothetical protein